jgi:CBS domain containing-hemolysin-like protein
MLIFFVSVGSALALSFLCSLLEATLLSYSPSQIAGLETKRPVIGKIWRSFKGNIEKPIAVILIVNTTAHTVGATIAGAQFEKSFGAQGLIIFSVIFTYLMLQFTEILPKTLGVRYSGYLAPLIAPPLEVLVRVLSPVLWFIQLINRPFSGSEETGKDTTLQEIAALAASSPLMDPHQSRMIQAASELESIRVRQIMTPRTEVMYLLVSQPIEEILSIVKRCPYTRLPLCDGDIDHVVGMVHGKDLMKVMDLTPGRFNIEAVAPAAKPGPEKVAAVPGTALHVFGTADIDLMKIKRDVVFLPDHLNVLEALRQFQRARLHLAVVVDEYGATIGIVTLEDVIEEMVGDIKDEFDLFAADMVKPEGAGFRVNGRLPLHEFVQYVPGIEIDPAEADVDTVGGYVSQVLGRLPVVGESIEVGPYTWTVSLADVRRVREVVLLPNAEPLVDIADS